MEVDPRQQEGIGLASPLVFKGKLKKSLGKSKGKKFYWTVCQLSAPFYFSL